jgi:hypothetical protein
MRVDSYRPVSTTETSSPAGNLPREVTDEGIPRLVGVAHAASELAEIRTSTAT